MTEQVPDSVGGDEDAPPAIATDGDSILKDGGRTDNAGEVDAEREPQDPNATIESDPSRVVADG